MASEKHIDVLNNLVLSIFPDAELGEDNDGQLLIYTGLKVDSKGICSPMHEED